MKNKSLIDFLLNEISIDVDPNDPQAVSKARTQINRSKANPARHNRDQVSNARKELSTVNKSENSPTKAISVRIARLKQQIATLQDQKSKISKRNNESLEDTIELCETVYVDENDNIIHVGEVLSETSIQAFKRSGNVISRKYRCTSGGKMGALVSNPNDCNKRKNPKSVKAGKISAKKHKTVRVMKSRISKNKSISKMVSRLNQKLKSR